jgi:hypothetical protein
MTIWGELSHVNFKKQVSTPKNMIKKSRTGRDLGLKVTDVDFKRFRSCSIPNAFYFARPA